MMMLYAHTSQIIRSLGAFGKKVVEIATVVKLGRLVGALSYLSYFFLLYFSKVTSFCHLLFLQTLHSLTLTPPSLLSCGCVSPLTVGNKWKRTRRFGQDSAKVMNFSF